ncbi:hypothetical protein EQV77_09530 [Halobacillus fulvus]|nr:hypothetical protein EQV77_09530 [Halobacillus fulvus]
MNNHSQFYKPIYKLLYIINDFTAGLFFSIGSILFYFDTTKPWVVTLFVMGSFQLMIRPMIKLIHEVRARMYYHKEFDQRHS